MNGFEPVGDWLAHALSYLAVVVSSLAAMILIAAAAPGFLRRERTAARSGMRRCFLWGVVFTINCVLVAALLALFDGMIGRLAALALMVALLVISLAGLAAIACEVGQRVLSLSERHDSALLTRIVVGTLVLFATAVIPVFGWLVFTGAILTGVGAFLETAMEDYRPTRRRVPAASAAKAPSAE